MECQISEIVALIIFVVESLHFFEDGRKYKVVVVLRKIS